MTDHSYEVLRWELEGLSASSGNVRNLRWLAPELAVGRNAAGDFEIFLRGEKLVTSSAVVRRHVQHDNWRPREGGEPFAASRIVLPSAPHFASVAALIAVELLRAGIAGSGNPQRAFGDVEPIIEMAIRRGALPENVVIGLIGELILLRQCLLVTAAEPARHAEVVAGWQGWQQGSRDLRIGHHSIEVKTTQAAASIHEFSGLYQLEAQRQPSGEIEELHLLSVGLAASTSLGESLPAIVDSVLTVLGHGRHKGSAAVEDAFLRNVEAYGAGNGIGYAHRTMNDWSVYSTRYTHTFLPRLYRVSDPAMLLLSREDIARTFVQPASVSFTLHVPDRVSAFNPAPNWQETIAEMINRS
ncbi:PD-(D/E)XK motif protein [Mesorhizobium sp. M0048]|uniref:PD-(D/E)XK motif protein n=1 Tax=Mesorhizobium sp. M0048 TaxID=2956860 RepID=UPI00333653F7